MGPSNSSDGLVASVGIFVGIAVATQWMGRRAKSKDRVCKNCRQRINSPKESPVIDEVIEDDDDSIRVDESAREWYGRRRLQDRLSFDGLDELTGPVEEEELESSNFPDYPDTVDFFPKNSNWNHFEVYHEFHSSSALLHTAESLGGDYLEDSISEEESDEVSLTSQNHFVWTEARYSESHHHSKPLPTIYSQKDIIPLLLGKTAKNSPSQTSFKASLNKETLAHHSSHLFTPDLKKMPSLDKEHNGIHVDPEQLPSEEVPRPPRSVEPQRPPRDFVFPRRTVSSSDLQARRRQYPKQVRLEHRDARTRYNARIMPNSLILVRHGQSMGNIDENLYSTTPDNAMPLTKLGWEQARAAGRNLKELLTGNVHFIVSPYVRSVETFHGMVSAWCDPAEFNHIQDRDQRLKAWYGRLLELGLTWHEDPRIREQDFGNYQEPEKIIQAKKDRHRFGAFYYRFPHGESASDVFDRISTFLDSLWRSFDTNKSRNYVLVTHGIAIRVLLARYFRYTIDQFHLLSNPRNCEMIVLGHDGHGRLKMDGRYELECKRHEVTKNTQVCGYKYHKRLRVLPKEFVTKPKIRISYDD